MDHLADEELARLTLCGTEEAFSLLVRRYERQVYSLAYSLSGNNEDAEDWAQEAFLQVFRALKSFDPLRGKFFSWMYRIAHNTCVNRVVSRDGIRSKDDGETSPKKKVLISIDTIGEQTAPLNDGGMYPEESLLRSERTDEVRRALLKMPEKYRLPIILQYMEGYSYKEISDFMGLPESTIETRLFRARKMLQEKLKFLLNE